MTADARFLLLLLALVAAACSEGSGATSIVTDSAGVEIVTSSAPAWTSGEAWTVDTAPLLDIGGSGTDPHFDLVEVVDAVRLSGGRIAVMNNSIPDLRFYDSSGAYLSTTGRAGEAPGEFRRIASILAGPGDTLYLYDYQLRRMNRIAPDGRFLSSVPMPPSGGKLGVEPFARLPDGSWAATVEEFSVQTGGGAQRDSVAVLHLPASLQAVADTVGSFPASELFIQTSGEGENRSVRVMPLPLGLSTTFALQDSSILVGNPERYEIRAYRSDGTLTRIIRRPVDREPLSHGELDRWKEDELASVDARGKERLEAAWKVAPLTSLKPAYGSIHVDQDGDLWVEHVKLVRSDSGTADVFDSLGRLLGTVALPPGLQIARIGPDYILGIWRDEMDLEHVRMYRLRKPAGRD